MPILGRAMLGHMFDRLKRARLIDKIAVATSSNRADDVLEEFCKTENIPCFRGSEDNVLERFAGCATAFPTTDHIIRVTGDCPLIDPELLDEFITNYLETRPTIDHYHLGVPNYPRGLDAEAFTIAALKLAAKNATDKYDQEHVTPYLYRNPNLFTSKTYISGEDHNHQRWCVDEEADFQLVDAIFKNLYSKNVKFTWRDVLELLDHHPELKALNQHVAQRNT